MRPLFTDVPQRSLPRTLIPQFLTQILVHQTKLSYLCLKFLGVCTFFQEITLQ